MTADFDLPIVTSCAGCGACCSVQGAPPDYVALSLNPHFAEDPSFAEDVARLSSLPEPAQKLLNDYLSKTAVGEIPTDGPCVWLDERKESCRFYNARPSTCRVFEMGGPGCFYYRKQAGRMEPLI